MKNNFEKTLLFSCPIYKIRIDPNSYDKEKIINDILYNKSLSNTRTSSDKLHGFDNCNIHHSYKADDNESEDFRPINYKKLIDVYQEIFNEFFSKELKVTTKTFKYWFNIENYSAIPEGQYLPIHDHIGTTNTEHRSDFSTIHYLNYKQGEHVPTRFHNLADYGNLAKNVQPVLFDALDTSDPDNSMYFDNFSFRREEDDFIIFPSILRHEITAQLPTEHIRITISTNLTVLKENEKNNN